MKKLIFGSMLMVAFPATAYAQEESKTPWSGPYFGVEAGMDNYDLSASGDLGIIDPDFTGVNAAFDGLSGNGVAGGVYAGYHVGFDGGFLALEGFGGISDASISLSVSDGVDTASLAVKSKESYGLAVRAGAKIARGTAIYARGGWINTNFEASISDGVDTLSVNETEDGFQYGAGLETMVGPKISMRAEYVINDYGDAGLGQGISVNNSSFRAGLTMRF